MLGRFPKCYPYLTPIFPVWAAVFIMASYLLLVPPCILNVQGQITYCFFWTCLSMERTHILEAICQGLYPRIPICTKTDLEWASGLEADAGVEEVSLLGLMRGVGICCKKEDSQLGFTEIHSWTLNRQPLNLILGSWLLAFTIMNSLSFTHCCRMGLYDQ